VSRAYAIGSQGNPTLASIRACRAKVDVLRLFPFLLCDNPTFAATANPMPDSIQKLQRASALKQNSGENDANA
jgi:hypothetical protein